MLTYGRLDSENDCTYLVNEALESFLRQDYPNKELILLNDTPEQKYAFSHPQVRVINAKSRYKSLGAKRNASLDLAGGELSFIWDDDDISLPWRLSQAVAAFAEDKAVYMGPHGHWHQSGNSMLQYTESGGWGLMAGGVFRTKQVRLVRYRDDDNVGEDQSLCMRLGRKGYRVSNYVTGREDAPIIYRWNHGCGNISAHIENGFERKARRTFPKTTIQLDPYWREDYVEKVEKTKAFYAI